MPYNSEIPLLVEEYSYIHLPISCKEMFTYAFTRTHIHIAIYTYPHVCIHVRIHIHTCVYMHICVYADMHVLGCDERFSSESQRKSLPKTGEDCSGWCSTPSGSRNMQIKITGRFYDTPSRMAALSTRQAHRTLVKLQRIRNTHTLLVGCKMV